MSEDLNFSLAGELEASFSTNPDPMMVLDKEGIILRANRAFQERCGFDPVGLTRRELALQKPLFTLTGQPVPIESLPSLRVLQGLTVFPEYHVFKDLTASQHILNIATPLRDSTGQFSGVAVVWHDVPEREILLRENQRQRELLEHVIQEAQAAIAFLVGSEHRYTLVNAPYLQIARGKGDLMGRTVAEVWPELINSVVPLLDHVYQTGEIFRAEEYPFEIFRNGELETNYFNYTFSPVRNRTGAIEGVMILAIEITEAVRSRKRLEQELRERKRTEQALIESEERFRQLADSMPQLVWTALPDGTVDYYNRRYLEFSGITPENASNWKWAPVLHPEDLEVTVQAFQTALKTGNTYQVEHRVKLSDGSYRWHLSRGIPARDKSGQIVKWFGTATDIHDQKEAEQSLVNYAAQLQASNQELEQFAFIASHDLQEPLRKIRAFGSRLKEKSSEKLNEHEIDYLNRMLNAAERMQDMVRDLLQLSRITTQAQPFKEVSLQEIVAEVVSDLEISIERYHGTIVVEELPTLEADAFQMRQLFQNLITNALKYHIENVPPKVHIWSQLEGGLVRLYIQDNGIGFDQNAVSLIFRPFQRLHGRSSFDGTGIGLAICSKIVQRHHGEITAKSQPGEGSTFIVSLPLYQSEGFPAA